MTDPKKGERVLAEGTVWRVHEDGGVSVDFAPADPSKFLPKCVKLHPHPGVPVADLLELVELLLRFHPHDYTKVFRNETERRLEKLIYRYQAAQKPREEDVWVRAKPSPGREGFYVIRHFGSFRPCPEDIRRDDD